MELEDFTGYMLRLGHSHAHEIADAAFPEGPHPREYAVLTALAASGPVSQQRLAERLRVNRTLMVAVADELERSTSRPPARPSSSVCTMRSSAPTGA